ncbi:MAG TPA: hypothetical protein VFA59_25385 [Vicinamibacterales bacterium]|nr:hypothetical protein [Vicinamibacterales bacterium]
MNLMRLTRLFAGGALAVVATACANGSSTSPSGNTTGTVTAPKATSPAASAQVRFADQPITLTVQNAAVSQSTGTTYSFEVATDTGFATKVQTKDGVAEGTSGQTSVRLDTLGGGKDYYWRARATGGGTTGPYSPVMKFTVGPAIILSTPVPISPLSGATTQPRPALRVQNVTRTGPAGAITYLFEVANSSAFTTVIMNATKAEGVNETGFIPTSDLPVNQTFYWRATALDAANGVQSAPSPIQSFTTRPLSAAEQIAQQLGQTLWPGNFPPGTLGHATMGEPGEFGAGWQIQTLYYAPGNVNFQSPDLEMLRLFDLLDRGFDPESAISWMNTNGYPTAALWYPPPDKAVIGLRYVYLAARGKVFTNGTWDIVVRVE